LAILGQGHSDRSAEAVPVEQLERGSGFAFKIVILAAPDDQHPCIIVDMRMEKPSFALDR